MSLETGQGQLFEEVMRFDPGVPRPRAGQWGDAGAQGARRRGRRGAGRPRVARPPPREAADSLSCLGPWLSLGSYARRVDPRGRLRDSPNLKFLPP